MEKLFSNPLRFQKNISPDTIFSAAIGTPFQIRKSSKKISTMKIPAIIINHSSENFFQHPPVRNFFYTSYQVYRHMTMFFLVVMIVTFCSMRLNGQVGVNADGRLELFVLGGDKGAWHKWQSTPNGGWGEWSSLGGTDLQQIAVGNNADRRLEVFALGGDKRVWHAWQSTPNGGWGEWSSLGGTDLQQIAVGNNADGRLELFALGGDKGVWHKWQSTPNGGWGEWSSLGGTDLQRIAVGHNADGRLELFALGGDKGVWHKWQSTPNGGWGEWSSLGGTDLQQIAVGNNADGRLELFSLGGNKGAWHKWQSTPNGGWGEWSSLGGTDLQQIANTTIIDKDNDGIDDRNEQILLEKYSPLYKYSYDLQEELFRPTDAIWYIKHCNLLTSGGGSINIPQATLQTPSILIDPSNNNGGNSSIYVNHSKTPYSLNLPNLLYSGGYLDGDGHDWPEIVAKGNIGLYGHVTPIPNSPGMYKIEYWQFFAYSRATTGWIGFLGAIFGPQVAGAVATVGDHAGDWTTVQLVVQAETGIGGIVNDKIVSIFHYHHGDESRFDMSNTTMSRPEAGNIKVFAQGDSYDAENTVALAMDNHSGLYVHPVVYIEWGGHEFWPNVQGSKTASAKHNGSGQYSYVCHDIPNLGEVESPLGDDFRIIMGFNGHWGSFNNVNGNPPGPCLHTEWQWPFNSQLRGKILDKYFEK
jgi:hypothetical protein